MPASGPSRRRSTRPGRRRWLRRSWGGPPTRARVESAGAHDRDRRPLKPQVLDAVAVLGHVLAPGPGHRPEAQPQRCRVVLRQEGLAVGVVVTGVGVADGHVTDLWGPPRLGLHLRPVPADGAQLAQY